MSAAISAESRAESRVVSRRHLGVGAIGLSRFASLERLARIIGVLIFLLGAALRIAALCRVGIGLVLFAESAGVGAAVGGARRRLLAGGGEEGRGDGRLDRPALMPRGRGAAAEKLPAPALKPRKAKTE